MKAVRCSEGAVSLVDVPVPAGDGIRVKIRSAGICGSDLHLLTSPFAPAVTLGHEMAGELSDGTAVAIEPIKACGHCDCCVGGHYNLCRAGPTGLLGVGHDGGMAEEIRVPETCLSRLPSSLPVRDACLVEPVAVAVHGLRRLGLEAGTRMLVIGGGTIGLCAVAAARAMGARVSLEARHDAQLEAGMRLGAEPALPEYDVVVDAAGTESALERAATVTRPRGTLLLLATYWDGMVMPALPLCMKELSVVPSSMYGRKQGVRDFDEAVRLLAKTPELAETVITHRFPLEAAVAAFEQARQRDSGAIKVVLESGA
ncbi:MAG: alcohol dehydrogenase catalytic domain-containing protein [Myxococcota bacterium]|nr:alcohol dehydrogenase catalytic domain-containing protein [Myxococcota bacterium]